MLIKALIEKRVSQRQVTTRVSLSDKRMENVSMLMFDVICYNKKCSCANVINHEEISS
jgi:hypothetical protein